MSYNKSGRNLPFIRYIGYGYGYESWQNQHSTFNQPTMCFEDMDYLYGQEFLSYDNEDNENNDDNNEEENNLTFDFNVLTVNEN